MTLGIVRVFVLRMHLGSVICECCDTRVILVNGVLVGVLCVIGVCVCLYEMLDGILMFPFDGYYR